MRIGILSDTHGKSQRLAKALETFKQHGAEAVVHCGDILTGEDVALLGGFAGPAYLAAGNMDKHALPYLTEAAKTAGVTFAADFLAVPLGDGQHLAVTHGHHETLLEELIRGGQYAYVCHGHTHRRRNERYGPTRVLNPGALYHTRDRKGESILLLDTLAGTVEFIKLPK
ncbi:MAG: YfcE family phosphodiesterase [Phycisphaerae bacterium]|nr:YfcE family phosphodiesterase [Phycisphaerae bacterium]